MSKKRYDKKYLDKYVEENNIELIGEYDKVNSGTIIKGKCKTDGCDEVFEKGFRTIIYNEGGPYCGKCVKINKKIKTENSEYITSLKDIWTDNIEKLMHFMDIEKRVPTAQEEDNLGLWFQQQKIKYNNGKLNKERTKIWREMINNPIYSQYIMTQKEIWLNKLVKSKKFIDDNNKRPRCECNITDEQLLGIWMITNINRYNKKDKYFMENYLEEWENFINDSKYIEYFKTDDEKWKDKLDRCKKIMDSKNKRPRAGSNDENEKSLGQWITDQLKKRTKKNKYREKLWNEFIIHPKYYKYMRPLKDIWTDNIEKLKKFMDIEKRVPTAQEEDKLGIWFQQQKIKYNSGKLNKERTKIWREMINNPIYSQYIMTQKEIWLNKLVKSKKFIDDNHRLPNRRDINTAELGNWISTNKTNYIQKDKYFMENYLEEWETFVNNPEYNEYFKTSTEIWLDKFNLLECHIINKQRFPSSVSDNKDEKTIGLWKDSQMSNYNHTLGEMKIPEIKQKWKDFMEKYKHLSGHNLPSLFDLNKWNEMFLNFKNIVTEINIIPYPGHESPNIHKLGQWKEKSHGIYKHISGVMKDESIYNTWDTFINSELYKKAFENNKTVRSFKLFMIEYEKVIIFEKEKGYIPKSDASDCYEIKLGSWLYSRRSDYKNKLLSPEKIDLLKKIPGWRLDLRCSVCKFFQTRIYNICVDCSNPQRNPMYQKTKEWKVVNNLRRDLPDTYLIHNKSVGNECTLQDRGNTNGHLYPDIRFELYGFDLIVEVDEHKHRGADYSCDIRRMYDIVAKLGVPCVFIRYNPDDIKSDYKVLLEMIKEYLEIDMDEINFNEDINGHKNDGLKLEYLFY